MGKISLYDFLSILLPGAILTLAIELIADNYNLIQIKSIELNSNFELTIFLSASIFIGSLINILSRKSLKIFKVIGLYTPILEIYKNSTTLEKLVPYFENKMESNEFVACENPIDKIEHLWSVMYFELEANNKIDSAKTFQSFYFFFRNFFILGFFLTIIFTLLISINLLNNLPIIYYFLLLFGNLMGILLSVLAGKWNRTKMVERLFWTYYSLHKKNSYEK